MRHNRLAGGLFAVSAAAALFAALPASAQDAPLSPPPSPPAAVVPGPQASVVELNIPTGHGTAFYIGNFFGISAYVTAAHVVAGVADKDITLLFADGHIGKTNQVLLVDVVHDIAVLASGDKAPPPAALAPDCRTPALGTRITSIGFPETLGELTTTGEVSSAGTVETADWPETVISNLTIAHGSSGGPVIGPDGRAVGIVVGWFSPTGFSAFVPMGRICEWLETAGASPTASGGVGDIP